MMPLLVREIEQGVRCARGAPRARHWIERDDRLRAVAEDFENACDGLPSAEGSGRRSASRKRKVST